MKKLLSILAAVGLTATASAAAVSCTTINNTGKNSLDSKGDVFYKTKDELRIKKDAELTKDGDYYVVKSTDLGSILDKGDIYGVEYSFISDGQNDAVGQKITPKYATQQDKVSYRVLAKDIDKNVSKNKLSKQVNAHVYVTVAKDTTDADGNKAGYKFYEQHYSWTICALDKKGQVSNYVEASQINIPRNPNPDITGVASVSSDKTTVTVHAENLYKLTADQLKQASDFKVEGASVSEAKVVGQDLVLTVSGLSTGSHAISSPLFEGTATVNVL